MKSISFEPPLKPQFYTEITYQLQYEGKNVVGWVVVVLVVVTESNMCSRQGVAHEVLLCSPA